MRRMPRPQTLRMTIAANVMPATNHSDVPTAAMSGPSIERRPAMPADMPIIRITRPEISGGKIARKRLSSGATAVSSRPAKIVMPNTIGSPPSRTASSDGAK